MARRPFSANGVRFTPPPGTPVGGGGSLADIPRAEKIAYLYCDHCIPPYTIRAVDFTEPPWNRFHNAPSGSRFVCPGCGHELIMHVHPKNPPRMTQSVVLRPPGFVAPPPLRKRHQRNWWKKTGKD